VPRKYQKPAFSDSDEQKVSGSAPEVESDDDLLKNAKDVGEQLDEDEEHPQEIDIARDINDSEKHQRN
jgi:hypothetical protein